MARNLNWIRPAAMAVLLLCQFGCVGTKDVRRFAAGINQLALASDAFYDQIYDTNRQLAMVTVDLESDRWQDAVIGENQLSYIRQSRAAVASLQAYAKSLHDLALLDVDSDVTRASQRLAESLNDAAEILQPGIGGDEGSLAEAIRAMANVYINVKKQRALRKGIRESHPSVMVILETLLADIERQQQRLGVTRSTATARREELFKQLKQGFASASEADKASRLRLAGELIAEEMDADAVFAPQDALVNRFRRATSTALEAHKTLRDKDYNREAIEDFIDEVRGLVDAVRTMQPLLPR